MNIIYIIVICLLVLVLAFSFRPNYEYYKSQAKTDVPIVYGAAFCGYCTKQKEELDAAKVKYTYIDCTLPENKEQCKDIKSYPTIKFPGQTELVVGKQPIDKFKDYIKK